QFGSYELILPSTEALTQFKRIERLSVPPSILRPEYASLEGGNPHNPRHLYLKAQEEEQLGMRNAGKLAAKMLRFAESLVQVGVTTADIDAAVHAAILSENAYPSPLNYCGYPKSICTSVNNVVCHGVPDSRPLKDGDLINIDITVYLNGFHGDTSATFLVGAVDSVGVDLVNTTKEAMEAAIAISGPGVPIREIGRIVSQLAKKRGFSVSPDFCGHGIGRFFHEPPLIIHSERHNNDDTTMEEFMTFTIEPALCQGRSSYVKWPDQWTAVTADGGRSAQFEHTIMIVPDGVEILTIA
ncbi:peptidase M24, structural domain-containing protein, partial [Cladochytrium replicatum]